MGASKRSKPSSRRRSVPTSEKKTPVEVEFIFGGQNGGSDPANPAAKTPEGASQEYGGSIIFKFMNNPG